uniref:Protein 3 n=1 Tax=Ophrys virus 1 TaxID=2977977 RepID=A0A9N7AB38_9RHAB|nr:TPA_asm: protein 3 [Ophrys virus 1]
MSEIGDIMFKSSRGIIQTDVHDGDKYVLDVNAPLHVPKEKITFTQKWNWTPRGNEGAISLGSLSLFDRFKTLRWNQGTIVDAELHIVFLPHLPVEIYHKRTVNIILRFNGTEDGDESVLAVASFPISLHTHVIFYPGHSFSLKRGGCYPWSLELSTDADIRKDYVTADIILQLRAYNTPLSQYSEKKGAHIISLVPLTESPTGVILTRPRQGGEWKTSKIKFGFRKQRDLEVLKAIQEAKIDVEALQTIGVIREVMSAVYGILNKQKEISAEDRNGMIAASTLAIVKKNGKVK